MKISVAGTTLEVDRVAKSASGFSGVLFSVPRRAAPVAFARCHRVALGL